MKEWKSQFVIKRKYLVEKKGDFIPKYINYCGKEIEMKKDGAELQTAVGIISLMFSLESAEVKCIQLGERMKVSTIENLRAAIYQTTESEGELKKHHEDMIQLLIVVEKKLMDNFLKKN